MSAENGSDVPPLIERRRAPTFRRFENRVFVGLSFAATCFAIFILAAILFALVEKGTVGASELMAINIKVKEDRISAANEKLKEAGAEAKASDPTISDSIYAERYGEITFEEVTEAIGSWDELDSIMRYEGGSIISGGAGEFKVSGILGHQDLKELQNLVLRRSATYVVTLSDLGSVKGDWRFRPSFFFNRTLPHGRTFPNYGIGNAILGTFIITFGAMVMGIPLGILGGIYLSEYGRGTKLANSIRFAANVMMGIPSIIVGLFVYASIVVVTGGSSGFAGSIALAILMFPVILRTTEDMLSLVPNALREAALSTGMPRWRVTVSVLFRAAKSGLITGVLLAIARVSGETAPLLFTASFGRDWPQHYFDSATANLTVMITEYAMNEPNPEMGLRAWGAALVISVAVLSLNIFARIAFREKTK